MYARHRPRYPGALFDYLATLTPARELAWDCATGNGQAAVELAGQFQRVIATDASPEQIEHAIHHPLVEYRVEPGEKTTVPSAAVDLVAVGTAVHWFDFEPFYAEVRRVGKPGAVLAVWGYHLPVIDRWLESYYRETVGPYWPERFHYLHDRYRTLPFPFEEIESPEFSIEAEWDLTALRGFLASWSATRRYVEANGPEAIERSFGSLARRWGGENDRRRIRWPLFLRIGRLSDSPRSASGAPHPP